MPETATVWLPSVVSARPEVPVPVETRPTVAAPVMWPAAPVWTPTATEELDCAARPLMLPLPVALGEVETLAFRFSV